MRSVSQSFIRVHDGFVPSRPMEPVTQGRSSGRTALPRSAFATPAPRTSATSVTSCVARSAPAPTSIATRRPAFRTSAARRRSFSAGTTRGADQPTPLWMVACLWGGCSMSTSWTSFGTIRVVTVRSARAMRTARSTRWRACDGTMSVWTYSRATSLKRFGRSTSCW